MFLTSPCFLFMGSLSIFNKKYNSNSDVKTLSKLLKWGANPTNVIFCSYLKILLYDINFHSIP